MKFSLRKIWLTFYITGLLMVNVPTVRPAAIESCVFYNPILYPGADPSLVLHEGYYYYVMSENTGTGSGITIRKTANLTDLGSAEPVQIWRAPSNEVYSKDIWAPELHYIDGKWYIYVAADDGVNANHRTYALQADTNDPQGTWTFKGKVADPDNDKWSIDATVFKYAGQLYTVWSGWPGDVGDFPQNLYIAPMSDPLTISGPRQLISTPDLIWENSIAAINEGPEVLFHDGQLSIVYAANASWTPSYNLGLLVHNGGDVLDPNSWVKNPEPVFAGYDDESGSVFGPGHAGFTTSPDGKQDWIVYHANATSDGGWEKRDVRTQPFTWNADGTPNFGNPIPASLPLDVPSGQPCNANQIIVNNNDAAIEYTGFWNIQVPRKAVYASDLNVTRSDGAGFEYTFNGTGIEIIALKHFDQGVVEVYIDDVLQETIDNFAEKQAVEIIYSNTNLANGQHTIRVVKESGQAFSLDALIVYSAAA
jgi:GH43 family beta-xylosidase